MYCGLFIYYIGDGHFLPVWRHYKLMLLWAFFHVYFGAHVRAFMLGIYLGVKLPVMGKTYQANSPATKERSPELQDTGCPKSPQNHRHLITHYWTLHCTPERRNPAPPTRTLTQASLTRKPWQATCTNPHTARKRHNKENSTNCQNTERTPQTQQFKQDEETEE